MLFWAKVYITAVCPLLCIMGQDMAGMKYYKNDDHNTYNGKALLKRQGPLESESCIIKGTPALESLLLSVTALT